MKIATHPRIVEVISRASDMQNALQSAGKSEYAKIIDQRITALRSERFVIGVAGSVNRGKSTFINGLLGQSGDTYAPINQYPATNVISIFSRSETPSTTVYFKDGSNKQISEKEIRLYSCEAHNGENKKGVLSIEAQGSFSGLEQGVFLVDTPGAGNALAAMHSQILLNFLPNADALIFLVTADEPLVESEKRLLQAIRKNDVGKIFFAMNKIDSVDDDELAESIEHNRAVLDSLGFEDASIFPISARNYLEKGSDDGSEQLLEAIECMISNDRVALLAERLGQLLETLSEQAVAELKSEAELMSADDETLRQKRSELLKLKKDLARNGSSRERAFLKEWGQAYSKLEQQVTSIRNTLKVEYATVIDGMKINKVKALGQTIHSDVALSYQERLEAPMAECEKSINEAQKAYSGTARQTILQVLPSLAPGSSIKSEAEQSLKIAAATMPSFVTAGVAAVTPGVLSGIITGMAPAATFALTSPSTWMPALAGTAASGTGAVTGMALMPLCAPIALGAVGFAAYRGFTSWKEGGEESKNSLKISVNTMLDEACIQIIEQLGNSRERGYTVVAEFKTSCDVLIENLESQIEEILEHRLSPDQIDERRHSLVLLEKKMLQLNTDSQPKEDVEAIQQGSSNALSLFSVNS